MVSGVLSEEIHDAVGKVDVGVISIHLDSYGRRGKPALKLLEVDCAVE